MQSGRTDKIALITCLKNVNVSWAFLTLVVALSFSLRKKRANPKDPAVIKMLRRINSQSP